MDAAGSTSLASSQQVRSSIEERPWTSGPVELPRGRSAKDPQARTSRYQCHSLKDLEESLRDYLENPPENPEHCTCELSIYPGVSFPTNATRPSKNDAEQLQSSDAPSSGHPHSGHGDPLDSQETLSVMQALMPTSDPKESMKKQRIIAKVIVESIQRVDGYRYSFHNNWRSGEDAAYRFSYYCNDSLLNKDRVANGKAGTQGKRATKPVYDCRGVISVKFSAKQQSLDVVYRHVPIHKTYEERAPVPRRDSKRRRLMEIYNPDALPARCRPKSAGEVESEKAKAPRPARKPKKKPVVAPDPLAGNSIESELRVQSMQSLLELMLPDKTAPTTETTARASEQTATPAPTPTISGQATDGATADSEKRKRQRKGRSCVICEHKRMRCDGVKPRCNVCIEKDWPCIFHEELNQDVTLIEISDAEEMGESTDLANKSPDELGTKLLEAQALVERTKTELDTLRSKFADARRLVKLLETAKNKAEQKQKAEREERERKAAMDRQAERELRAELERQARRAAAQHRQQNHSSQHSASRQQQTQYEFSPNTSSSQTFGLPYGPNNNRQQYQASFVSTYSHQSYHPPNGYAPAPSTPQQQQSQPPPPPQQQQQRTAPKNMSSNFRAKPNADLIRWGPVYGYAPAASHTQQQVQPVNAPPPMTGQQPGLQESYRWLTNGTR